MIQGEAYIAFAIADLLVNVVISKNLIHYIAVSMNSTSSLIRIRDLFDAYPFEEHQEHCGECK